MLDLFRRHIVLLRVAVVVVLHLQAGHRTGSGYLVILLVLRGIEGYSETDGTEVKGVRHRHVLAAVVRVARRIRKKDVDGSYREPVLERRLSKYSEPAERMDSGDEGTDSYVVGRVDTAWNDSKRD